MRLLINCACASNPSAKTPELPFAKIVVLVRDPVERAYSQHAHEVARGYEQERDFGGALALEPARLHRQEERLARDPDYYSFAHQHIGLTLSGVNALAMADLVAGRARPDLDAFDLRRFGT